MSRPVLRIVILCCTQRLTKFIYTPVTLPAAWVIEGRPKQDTNIIAVQARRLPWLVGRVSGRFMAFVFVIRLFFGIRLSIELLEDNCIQTTSNLPF